MSSEELVAESVKRLRARIPGVEITGQVIEGRVVDGTTIEISGAFGVSISVTAKTPQAAYELASAALDEARANRVSYTWPPRPEGQQ